MNKKLFLFLSLLSMAFHLTLTAMSIKLYEGMDYKKIFNQKEVLSHPDFHHVLTQEGITLPMNKKVVEEKNVYCSRVLSLLTCQTYPKRQKYSQSMTLHKKNDDFTPPTPKTMSRQEVVIDIYDPEVTSEELNKTLIYQFRKEKKEAMKRSLYKPLYTTFIDGLVVGVAPYVANLGALGSGIRNMIIMNLVAERLNEFSQAFYNIYVSRLGDPLDKYEEIYAQKKRFFPPSLQQKIENKFGAARKDPRSLESVLDFCEIALNLPISSFLQSSKFVEKNSQEIETLILYELRDYENSIQKKLMNFLLYHIIRSLSKSGMLTTPKSILYFAGPPGSGKTYTAQKMADILESKLIKIQITSNNASELIGTDQSPGQLLEALAQNSDAGNDTILFIDEIDRIINTSDQNILSVLLPLLEPTTTHFYSPYLKGYIDISRFLIIGAGNNKIKDDALQSRVECIHFKMLPQQKENIILNSFIPNLCAHNIDALRIKLTQEQLQHIKKELIKKDNNDKGIRNLQLKVTQYVNQLRLKKDQ